MQLPSVDKIPEQPPMRGVGSSDGSAIYTQRERFVIRYQGITGQTMYVVEIGEPHEEWSRNIRASNKLSSAKLFTLYDAAMELEKVREVQPHAELHALPNAAGEPHRGAH